MAGLPSELEPEPEEAKRFDLLMLRLQLAVLHAEPAFERLRDQAKEIAGLLEEKASIPMVREQLPLIHDVQTDEWWQDATTPMLETVRKRLRSLVRLIEKASRKPVYTDFEDELGVETEVVLPGFVEAHEYERFCTRVRAFLLNHPDHHVVQKLRTNQQVTAGDLTELEELLACGAAGTSRDIDRAKTEAGGLGLFVRSLTGLDHATVESALAGVSAGGALTPDQKGFVRLIADHLTERGVVDAALLYESPFTDVSPRGPDGIFTAAEVSALVVTLDGIRATATAP